jgi:uncharacterized membrane protein
MNTKSNLELHYDRPFFLRSKIDRLITLSMLFSCILVPARIIYTGRLTFIFLVWNLILAYVPYFITQMLTQNTKWLNSRVKLTIVVLAWLAFIPNSFYILTDLFHLQDRYNDRLVPQWYDLAMIFSFAWNGLLLGILSIRQMEKIICRHLFKIPELLFLCPVMWMNAWGVYIGRYLRYNSWDVLTDPLQLSKDICVILLHPIEYKNASGMIFCFSILMTLFYLTLKKLGRAIR